MILCIRKCIFLQQLKITHVSAEASEFSLSKQPGTAALRIVIKETRKLTNEISEHGTLDVAGWLNHAQDAN